MSERFLYGVAIVAGVVGAAIVVAYLVSGWWRE